MNEKLETRNARIDSTMLGMERGFMTFMLQLDYGNSSQAAGGYQLNNSFGGNLIREILNTVGVERWEELPGKNIRARCDSKKVHAIGHYLYENWLCFDEFFGNK